MSSAVMAEKPDVFIATPTHGGDVCAPYCAALLQTIELLTRSGYGCKPDFIMYNAVINYARAIAVQRFMESGAEYLLFIDSDLWWEPLGALALIQSPHEFVAGVYPAKTPEHNKVFQTRDIRESATQNYVETDGVPGGFMRLKRSVIEKMVEAYPELIKPYKGTRTPFLFETLFAGDAPLGEDYAFCYRWRELGHKIFIYPDIKFTHYGRGEWHGNMIEDHPMLKVVE